jgi:hypothetical protein
MDQEESLPGSLVASPADMKSVGSDVPVGKRQMATEDAPPSVFQDKKIPPPPTSEGPVVTYSTFGKQQQGSFRGSDEGSMRT